MRTFTAYVEWDPDSRLYVRIVPGVPGAHTQGATLDAAKRNPGIFAVGAVVPDFALLYPGY
jgi:predicted RNase H-like HicB family nuclease